MLAISALPACGSTQTPAVTNQVDNNTYVAVISRFVPPSIDADSLRVVYLAGTGMNAMSLEDQILVIDRFASTHDVRFVDELSAAVDSEAPGSPPRDEGVLIEIGAISNESPHIVRVEVYTDADRIDAQLVTLAFRQGDWEIELVEPVEPEVLVEDE